MEIIIFTIIGLTFLIYLGFEITKKPTNKKSIEEMNYQEYADFYGLPSEHDEKFRKKLEKIYNLIVKNKCEDLDFIAKDTECSYNELIIKIKYLKLRNVLTDYYLDQKKHFIKKCTKEDRRLLKKYSAAINGKHESLDKFVASLPHVSMENFHHQRQITINELNDLVEKGLLTGIKIDPVDNEIIYFEQKGKGHDFVTVICPSCGAKNEVNRGTKKRCSYCKTIIESKLSNE